MRHTSLRVIRSWDNTPFEATQSAHKSSSIFDISLKLGCSAQCSQDLTSATASSSIYKFNLHLVFPTDQHITYQINAVSYLLVHNTCYVWSKNPFQNNLFYFQTGLTLSHLIYHLAHNPETQEKLYQELKVEVRAEEPIPPEVMEGGLSYLKATVKESQRLDSRFSGHSQRNSEIVYLQYIVSSSCPLAFHFTHH